MKEITLPKASQLTSPDPVTVVCTRKPDGSINLATTPVSWCDTSDVADVIVLRQCTKDVLYTVVNSNAMNGEVIGYAMPIWTMVLYAVDAVEKIYMTVSVS